MNALITRFLPLAALILAGGKAHATILISPIAIGSAPPFDPVSFGAGNTVDNMAAEYASLGQGDNTFLEYSFGTPQTFNRIVVMNRDSGGFSDQIANFTLTMDNGPTVSIMRPGMRGASQFHDTGPQTATIVRLDVDTIGTGDAFNNTGAMEVIFARTPAGQTQIPGVTLFGSAPAFSVDFDATNALDGNIGRISALIAGSDWPEYASAGQGSAAFVDFNLGGLVPVGGFDWFDRPHQADRVTAFDMIFSQDAVFGNGDDVTRSYTNTSNAMALGDEFAAINAQYVRYDVTGIAGGVNTGLSEMIFYQVPEPSSLLCAAMALSAVALRRRR